MVFLIYNTRQKKKKDNFSTIKVRSQYKKSFHSVISFFLIMVFYIQSASMFGRLVNKL